MAPSYFKLVFLLGGCCGTLLVLGGAGVALYLVLRKKKNPRGFDVEQK